MKNSRIIATLVFSTVFNLAFATNQNQSNLSELEVKITEMNMPSCNGMSDATVSIEVIGGQEPYSYNWNSFPNQYESTARNLSAGIYFVYVKDARGHSTFQRVEILDPIISPVDRRKGLEYDQDVSVSIKSSNVIHYMLNDEPINELNINALKVLRIS